MKHKIAFREKVNQEDQLIRINDTNVAWSSFAEWKRLVQDAREPITLTFRRYKAKLPIDLTEIQEYVIENSSSAIFHKTSFF